MKTKISDKDYYKKTRTFNFQAIVASMRLNFRLRNSYSHSFKLLQAWLKSLSARRAVNPQSTVPEAMIMSDLKIGRPLNETSGDGHKNGKNYELKFSSSH